MLFKKSKNKKIISLFATFCIFVSLLSSYTEVFASSKNVTIYVVSKLTITENWKNPDGTKGNKVVKKYSLDYNKKGLVEVENGYEKSPASTYKYTNKNIYKGKYVAKVQKSSVSKQNGKKTTSNGTDFFVRNKKNILTKITTKGKKGYTKYKIKCNSKNKITYVLYRDSKFPSLSHYKNYEYDSSGRISKVDDAEIEYDSHGYAKAVGTDKFKNTYKSNRLTKRVLKGEYLSSTYKFSYKKINVPVKYKSAIERQQRYIIERGYDVPWYY